MRKCIVLMLITYLVTSSLLVFSVAFISAQAGYKPSVPQVIVKLGGTAYDVSDSIETVTDPFTGEDYTITHPGYRVADWSFEFTVKNQPFTRYTDADDRGYSLQYVVEFKNHLDGEQEWKAVTTFFQYETQYTTTTHQVICKYHPYTLEQINSLPAGSQLDFRVKADVVYGKSAWDPDHLMSFMWTEYVSVASSGWSDVHTITLSDETHVSSPPTQIATFPPVTSDGNGQPQYPDQSQPPNSIFSNPLFTLVIGVLLVGVIVAVVLVILSRHMKTPTYTDNSVLNSYQR